MTGFPPASLHAADVHIDTRLRALSLHVQTGDCLVLLGPNGAGKSTLLRACAGLLPPSHGKLSLNGHELSRLSARERARHLAWLPQRPPFLPAQRSEELVAQARYRFAESPAQSLLHARAYLKEWGLSAFRARLTTELSGGELQRVLLATLLAQETPLLLLDEPANHLDPKQQIFIYQKLGELWQAGRGLLLVTHDLRLCRLLAPAAQVRILGLSASRVLFETTLADPTLPALLHNLYGVPFLGGEQLGELDLTQLSAQSAQLESHS